MRKFLPILLTFVVLVGIFIAYFGLQPELGNWMGNDKKADKFAPIGGDKNSFIKPGTGAWVKQYDQKGQIYYQFKSDYYDPQPDGTVKVTHPVIQFFLSNSQVLQIEGVDGDIRFAPGTDKGVMSNSPTDPPRYGNLRNVIVKIFGSPEQQARDLADMTMTMTNAQFDNDTYTLFTQEYAGADGKIVHADEVPVTVNAKDYAFSGSGLLMYWNDLDKQLKSLEIAHGKDLTVYNASAFSAQGTPAATQPAGASVSAPGVTAPVATAVVAPTSAPSEASAAPPADNTRHRYLATFFDHVRVLQAGQELIRADRMDADFISRSGGDSTADSSPPPAQTEAAPVTPSTESVSPPATGPSTEPIHIHWTGKMVMVPNDQPTAPPLPDGKAIIHFAGTPVVLHQTVANSGADSGAVSGADSKEWIDARCSDLSYHTADSSAVLTGKVELSQTKGGVVSSVTGESLNFSRATHLALFDGPGRIRLPDPNDAKSVMTADYGRSCRVHFFDVDSSQMQVERADLAGNVVVDHPRFHLTAINNVGLQFDAVSGAAAQKSSSPALRRITAIGNADCVVHEANKKDRRIAGQQLQLLRDPGPDGTLYAKTIICDGSVKAIQDDQMLSAEHLQIGLLPTRGKTNGKSEDEVALDTLTASTNVVITGNDSYASADQLYVKMLDGHAHVTLYGLPGQNAKVRDKSSTMTGPMIHLSPHDQTASIEGAGSFAGLEQPKDPRQKPRPLVLTWLKKATLNGNTNEAFVVGEVSALSDEPGGSRDSAKCDYILATLVDVPATKPTGAPAANKPGDANGYGADADFMKNKQIDVLSLRMDDASAAAATTRPSAEMQSYLTDAGGYLLHQYNLLSKQIDYEVPSKRLIVPGPGEIFAREQAPRGDAAAGDAGSGIGGHGSTAIQWHKRFIFDDAEHTAVIDGGVTIVHVTDGKKPEQTRLDNADIVQAKFATGETQAGQANSGDGDNSQVRQLKSLTATGKMIVRTTDKTIYCGEFDFDPSEQTLTCRGGVLGKVTVVDDNNLAGGTCAQAVFNLKTNELKKMTDVTGQER